MDALRRPSNQKPRARFFARFFVARRSQCLILIDFCFASVIHFDAPQRREAVVDRRKC